MVIRIELAETQAAVHYSVNCNASRQGSLNTRNHLTPHRIQGGVLSCLENKRESIQGALGDLKTVCLLL